MRRFGVGLSAAIFTFTDEAEGCCDQSRAIVPVTKGADALVPANVRGRPLASRLVMLAPGAVKPFLPIELPKFDVGIIRPCESHAATGIDHGCRVRTELPTVP